MVTIRLRVGLAGVDFALASGDLYTCPPEVAARFVAAGNAEYVTASSPIEATVNGPTELAAHVDAPGPRGRQKGARR